MLFKLVTYWKRFPNIVRIDFTTPLKHYNTMYDCLSAGVDETLFKVIIGTNKYMIGKAIDLNYDTD